MGSSPHFKLGFEARFGEGKWEGNFPFQIVIVCACGSTFAHSMVRGTKAIFFDRRGRRVDIGQIEAPANQTSRSDLARAREERKTDGSKGQAMWFGIRRSP